MTRLALDLGTKTGYALRGIGATVHGVINLKGGRFEGGGMRFLRLRDFLQKVHAATPFDEIVFEEVRRHRGTDAAHIYGGLLAVVTMFCEKHKIPYQGIPVQHIKIFAAGKGNASKEAVIAGVKAKGYPDVTDDNEADAIALLLFRESEDWR